MKITLAAFALAALGSLSPPTAGAQTNTAAGSTSDGEPTFITPAEFAKRVHDGTLIPIIPSVLAQQKRRDHETLVHSWRVVDGYLRRHRDLTDLAQLVRLVPDLKDPALSRAPGGDFDLEVVDNLGETQVFETMGRAFKFNELASSIESESDPDAQLGLYSLLYDSLPPSLGVTGVTPPADLRGARLGTIRRALRGLVAALAPIVANVPPPIINPLSVVPSCEGDIGSSTTPDVNLPNGFGDQAVKPGCPVSPQGIMSNLTFPARPYLTCVKNQAKRGTCHIFASTSAVEESVALQTGKHVNLSEQEFMEFEKGSWDPDFFVDGGPPANDLRNAAAHNYHFAYERQWDYNPSFKREKTPDSRYTHSCDTYPDGETACSNSSPQGRRFCMHFFGATVCGFAAVSAAGAHSPYQSTGSVNIFYPDALDFTGALMKIGLAFNIPIVLSFEVSPAFRNPTDGFVAYSTDDLKASGGNHGVHVIAYVSNEQLAKALPSAPSGEGGGYFVVKNSWGACAGDAGYFYMPVSYLLKRAVRLIYLRPVAF